LIATVVDFVGRGLIEGRGFDGRDHTDDFVDDFAIHAGEDGATDRTFAGEEFARK